MSSFLAPQIDHNIYNPVLPQTNVAQVFELMGVKNQIYNTNLARVNSRITSMDELSSAVTNENTKKKIDEYTTEAKKTLRKYTNLDFSIEDNVRAIDNLYAPLIKDQDFKTDYSATAHVNSEMERAFALRDSDKKEDREAFSMTNLEHVAEPLNLLKNAKNSKELKMAAAVSTSRFYEPYTDYTKEIKETLNAMKAEVSFDTLSGGYIVTTKNGATGENYTHSIKKYLDLTLSDKAKRQIKIEAAVAVDREVRSQGIEKVTTDYIEGSLKTIDKTMEQYSKKLSSLEHSLDVLPSEDKMNDAERKQYAILQDVIETYSDGIEKLKTKKSDLATVGKKLEDGTFAYQDFLDNLYTDVAGERMELLTTGLAESHAGMNQTFGMKEDPVYAQTRNLQLQYAELEQRKLEHADDMLYKEKQIQVDYDKINADLMKEGLKLNPDGTVGTFTEAKEDVPMTVTAYNAEVAARQLQVASKEDDLRTFFRNTYASKHEGKMPPPNSGIENRFVKNTGGLPNWDKDYTEGRNRILGITAKDVDNEEVAKNFWRQAVKDFNAKAENKGSTLTFNELTGMIEEKTPPVKGKVHAGDNIFESFFTDPVRTLGDAMDESFLLRKAGDVMGLTPRNPDDGKLTKKETYKEKFEAWVVKPKTQGGYEKQGALSITQKAYSSGKPSLAVYKKIENSVVTYLNSNPPTEATLTELLKANPEYGDTETLKYALNEFITQSSDDKFQPAMKFMSEEEGTNFVLPKASYEAKDGAEKKAAIDLLKVRGLNLPIAHQYYAKQDRAKGIVEGGQVANIKGWNFSKLGTGDKPYVVYPGGDNSYHYLYEADNKKYEVIPSGNGFAIKKLKTPINVSETDFNVLNSQGLSNFAEQNSNNNRTIESTAFRNKLSDYIESHEDLRKISDRDGRILLDEQTIKSLMK
jgi:hypothetical protein